MTPLVAIALAGFGVQAILDGSPYSLHVLSLCAIYAIAALGYQLVFGHAGALALSQGTFMGIGAYVSAILGVRGGIAFDAALPASAAVPAALAALVGIPVLRLRTHYFALATLVIGQIALLVATQWESITGGANGIGGVAGLSLGGIAIGPGWPTLTLTWALAAAAGLAVRQITRGPYGAALAMMRAHPTEAASVGIDAAALRLTTFILSAGFAGVAGALYVRTIGVISPDVLGFPLMVTLLTIVVVGGRRHVLGAMAGALVVIELPEWFRFLRDDYLLAYGCVLLLVIMLAPEGLVATAETWVDRVLPSPPRRPPEPIAIAHVPRPAGMLLDLVAVGRSFGGVRALDGVSLNVAAGEVVGLIGPNGSGKTTLVNLVTGIFRADSGGIVFDGRDITRAQPHAIARGAPGRGGIGRGFQTPALIDDLTALENVALARGIADTTLWRALGALPRDRRAIRLRGEAMALLERIGAADAAMRPAGSLPQAMRRRVEIARALAGDPRLLLLDEPAAGLTEAEQADLAARLREIAGAGMGLLVVEHSQRFLETLADRLVCLDGGRVIASGPADAVRRDPRVIAAYLGQPARAQ